MPVAQFHRPQSAMANQRMQKQMPAPNRPFTASEVHPATFSATQAGGRRTCRAPFSSIPVESFSQSAVQGFNESNETQPKKNSYWASRRYPKTLREVSLSTAFSSLCLHGKTQSAPIVDLKDPFTPSQIPKRIPGVGVPAENPSPIKLPKKKKTILPFLTRDSNTRVASWENTEDRITNMEMSMEKSYSEFKEKMDGMTSESNSLREVIEVYKARGELKRQQFTRLSSYFE